MRCSATFREPRTTRPFAPSCGSWKKKGTLPTKRMASATSTCPRRRRRAARKSAFRHLVDTFFDGSAEQVVAAVLGGEGARLSDDELDRIAELVEKAKKEGSR